MTGIMLAVAVTMLPPLQAPRAPAPAVAMPAVKSVTFGAPRTMSGAVGVRAGTVTGGQEGVLRVDLTGPAPCVERCGSVALNGRPSGYMPVEITTTNAAQVPVQRLLVPTGDTFGEVKFVTTPVAAASEVTVTAQAAGSAAQRGTLTILAPVLMSLVVDRPSVVAGEIVKAAARFSGPPVTATSVKLAVQTTNSTVLKVPPSVYLPVGATTVTFDVAARGVERDVSAQLVAMHGDQILPASVAVRAATLQPITSPGGNWIRLNLNGSAPPQGAVIALVSDNPARIAVAASATIKPESSSVSVHTPSTPGPSTVYVPITATYNGVSQTWKVMSYRIVKPDLVLTKVVITDRFGNVITTAPDGQPVKVCSTISSWVGGEMLANVLIPSSVFRLSYQTPTGTGTSTGRDVDLPLVFTVGSYGTPITHCVDLPGLAPTAHHDVTLTLDARNEVDEERETNNTQTFRITRQ